MLSVSDMVKMYEVDGLSVVAVGRAAGMGWKKTTVVLLAAGVTIRNNLGGRPLMRRCIMDPIKKRVAQEAGLTLQEFSRKTRAYRISHARQRFMYEAHEAGCAYGEIGRYLGMDHTNIMHGARRHQERLDAKIPEVWAA